MFGRAELGSNIDGLESDRIIGQETDWLRRPHGHLSCQAAFVSKMLNQ